MARPSKKTPPAKVHQLPVRFTEDLFAVLTDNARKAGLTRGEYIRHLVAGKTPNDGRVPEKTAFHFFPRSKGRVLGFTCDHRGSPYRRSGAQVPAAVQRDPGRIVCGAKEFRSHRHEHPDPNSTAIPDHRWASDRR